VLLCFANRIGQPWCAVHEIFFSAVKVLEIVMSDILDQL
jgi:hypothetical protein